MTEQEQQIAIAEFCGWQYQKGTPIQYGGTNINPGWINPTNKRIQIHLPDYLHDLNSIHEAELKLTIHQFEIYQTHIGNACYGKNGQLGWVTRDIILATAAQRCEALLRAIGKWKD